MTIQLFGFPVFISLNTTGSYLLKMLRTTVCKHYSYLYYLAIQLLSANQRAMHHCMTIGHF